MKYLPLFHHFKAIYQFPKHRICLVKIVANASLNIKITRYRFSGTSKHRSGLLSALMISNVHSGHEERGLSDIKVDHFIRNLICNRMQ